MLQGSGVDHTSLGEITSDAYLSMVFALCPIVAT